MTNADCVTLQLELYRTRAIGSAIEGAIAVHLLCSSLRYLARRRNRADKLAREILYSAAIRVAKADIEKTEGLIDRWFGK